MIASCFGFGSITNMVCGFLYIAADHDGGEEGHWTSCCAAPKVALRTENGSNGIYLIRDQTSGQRACLCDWLRHYVATIINAIEPLISIILLPQASVRAIDVPGTEISANITNHPF